MAEILFYHLTESKLEDALPPLLEKSLERGWRVTVQGADAVKLAALDAHLWIYRDDSFLPHGADDADHASQQPVLLTLSDDNMNQSTVRFLVDGAAPPQSLDYDRIVFVFDGYDQPQVEAARGHWKQLKAEGHNLTYWQQTPEGRWEKKA